MLLSTAYMWTTQTPAEQACAECRVANMKRPTGIDNGVQEISVSVENEDKPSVVNIIGDDNDMADLPQNNLNEQDIFLGLLGGIDSILVKNKKISALHTANRSKCSSIPKIILNFCCICTLS